MWVKGEVIIGANILEKGINNGTVTDIDGKFSLQVSPNATLIVSYIGYNSQEVSVGNKTELRISLAESALGLDEVVVVGYGSQSKRNVTGAISSVNSEVLTRSTSTVASQALAGKVQGVTTRATDARPGRGINVQIRNMGDPLYVIDGIPYGGVTGLSWLATPVGSGADIFNSLALEDIESISILKDASAAVYGLRASNGVVLVTTKKGKRDESFQINLNGYYGWQNLMRYPKPATAGQFIRAQVESEQNLGRDPRLLYSPEELAKWEAGTEKGYQSFDYLKMVMRPNVPQNYVNVNATGGSKRSTYYLSLANTSQDATIRDFHYNKTNLQANLETNLAQGLTVGTQISALMENTQNLGLPGGDDFYNPLLSVFSMWPTERPYANDNPAYVNQTHNINVNPATYKKDISGWANTYQKEANINLYAQYDFKFGLSAKATYSYNYKNILFDAFEYTYPAYRYNQTNDTYETQPSWGNQNPWRGQQKRDVISRYSQFQLNYKKDFEDHNLSAVVAYERSDYDNTMIEFVSNPTNNYVELISLAELTSFSHDWLFQARAGYIGRINYNYKSKYLLEILGRYDGSYLYAPEKRWGFFPGISLGWRISDETFFDNLRSAVNDFKIRASYGQTGSESGVNAFDYLGGYNYRQGSSILDNNYVIGLRPRGLPITNLSWVTNTSMNVGVDLAFLDRKLTTTVDVFQRKRTGLPAARYDVVVPSEVGYTLPNENLNSDTHRGIEGIITYTDQTGDLNYSISANATFSRARLLETYKPRFSNSWDEYRNSKEDRWDGITWGYQVAGRFQSVDEINNYPIDIDGQGNRSLLPGDFIYKDVNGDKIINALDERPIGYARGWAPYVGMGLNTSFEWKRITLSIDFSGGGMQSFLRTSELKYPFQNNGSGPSYLLADRWHQEDPYDGNSRWIEGTYPAIRRGFTTHSNFSRTNDFWLVNVRYFRLKNLEIGYNLPESLISKVGVSKLRVYANGSNLFSLDNVGQYEIDPEISSENALAYPLQRLIMVGINVSF